MKFPHRRRFLHLAAGAAGLPFAPRVARAQAYPSRPVRIIVGFAAGGTTDIHARQLAQALTEHLGQPFIVENRPGAGSNIATEAVVKAAPDGYTLLQVSGAHTINATLYDKLSFNFIRDIAPVASTMRVPFVMDVNQSFPSKTVPEFIAYAKRNSGKINMASAGIGTTAHVAGELFKMMAGVDLIHVPYRGEAPAMGDLLGGQVQVLFAPLPGSVEYIKSGKLRGLGVTTTMRTEALPDLPTLSESVQGYEASSVYGLGAPRGTPTELVEKLNREINAALADAKLKLRIAEMGGMALAGSSSDFGKLIADETEKWGKVIKFANIKPE